MKLWYPEATIWHGPAWKGHGNTNSAEGVIWHSAEGSWGGLQYELARNDRSAAWHLSCLKDGKMYQHYALDAVLHHAGDWGGDQDGADGNGETIAIEFEGKAGEQLTPAQITAGAKFVHWLSKQTGWKPTRTAMGRNQWEHRELSDLPTACPSNRMPWPVIMRELDRMGAPPVTPPKSTSTLSPPLNPEAPNFWPSIFDAVNGGMLGEHERLPQTKNGWGEYLFRLKL